VGRWEWWEDDAKRSSVSEAMTKKQKKWSSDFFKEKIGWHPSVSARGVTSPSNAARPCQSPKWCTSFPHSLPTPCAAPGRVMRLGSFHFRMSYKIQCNSTQAVQRLHLKWPAANNYHSVEKECSNRNVFSLRLKMLESVISWIAWDRLFHALHPTWKNSVRQSSA